MKGGDLVDAAISNNWAVAFPKWNISIKDAAAASAMYGRLLTVSSIISSAITNADSIRLRWEITQNSRNKHIKLY